MRLKRLVKRSAAGLGVVLVVAVAVVLIDGWSAFGKRAQGERRTRMEASPQWDGSAFENPQPLYNDWLAMLTLERDPNTVPSDPLPVVQTDPRLFATPPASGLRATWLGHSSLLIELDGHTVLTDPVWSERASPLDLGGAAALVRAAAGGEGSADAGRGGDLA